MPNQQAVFIKKLRELASQYTSTVNPWTSKRPLTWNPDYLEVGYLLIPDIHVQAQLCFWAACSRDTSTMAALLFKAVCHGLLISISIKVEDFGRFKPEEVSDTDHLVGKPSSTIEAPFTYTAQGALCAYYESCERYYTDVRVKLCLPS